MKGTARRRALVGALAALGLVLVPAAPSLAASLVVSATSPGAATMSPSSDANEASSEARALRREVASLLQGYIDEYRDRFTEAEVTQLLSYRTNADRQLASVVVTTNRLRNSITSGASASQVRTNRSQALKAWSRAKATAESSWESARQIMEPRLSLFEKVGAANDYNAMMGRFDDLGDRIRSLG